MVKFNLHMNHRKLYFIIIFLFIIRLAYSQDCTDYHEFHCLFGDYTFFYSKQSRSMLMRPGQKSELKIVAYGGEDYFVSVCATKKFGKLRFRIIEDTPEKSVLFDNAENNYEETVIFSNEVTRNLIIEVSVPEATSDKKAREYRCVGVVIMFRKTQNK